MPGTPDFESWARTVLASRIERGAALYDLAGEHYLESTLLASLNNEGGVRISGKTRGGDSCNVSIQSALPPGMPDFQLPALHYPGQNGHRNRAGYIDIFARTTDDRPVLVELKLWGKGSGSRGQYVFHAFPQLLAYWSFVSQTSKAIGEIPHYEDLLFDNPLLIVVVNDLGNDNVAERLREKYRAIVDRAKVPLMLAEFDSEKWRDQRTIDFTTVYGNTAGQCSP